MAPMVFCPLFSGSSGNALFVQAGNTRLLIDAGLSGCTVIKALEQIGVDPQSIDGILVTHEHTDHVKGAGILSRKLHLPIYANALTWEAMERNLGPINESNRVEFDTRNDFYIGDIGVVPFSIPHDAADPVGFRLYFGRTSIATATDLGHFTKGVLNQIAGSSLVLLESNHDPDMLLANPHYTHALKKRILGNRGHLSNDACADAIEQLVGTGVKHIILGHLSGENNLPELAYQTTNQRLVEMGLEPGKDVQVDMAWRNRVGGVYTLREDRSA